MSEITAACSVRHINIKILPVIHKHILVSAVIVIVKQDKFLSRHLSDYQKRKRSVFCPLYINLAPFISYFFCFEVSSSFAKILSAVISDISSFLISVSELFIKTVISAFVSSFLYETDIPIFRAF